MAFVYYLVPPFWEHLHILVGHFSIATHDARAYLVWTLSGIIFFLRSLYYEGEGIGFKLFRATGLAFAIRPKDGVARQGRRGGFHCCCIIRLKL